MKMRTLALLLLAAAASSLAAMPTKQELKQVEGLVQELMRPEVDAMKAGKKNRADVAKAAVALAEKAESEASKLLLLKGAFTLYVAHGAFDEAISVLRTIKATIPDISPQHVANMVESALRNIPKSKGGQLYRILDDAKARARHQDALKAALEKSAKRPGLRALHVAIAEHYAYFGDWPRAFEEFAKGDNAKAAEVAKAEKGEGKMSQKAIAEFWWNYVAADEGVQRAFRRHAADVYAAAIASGGISGLETVLAKRRIDEAKEYGEDLLAPVEKKSTPSGGNAPQGGNLHDKVQLWEGGPYWATTNIGAESPEDYGYYFWWGDTVGYTNTGSGWISVKDGMSISFNTKSGTAASTLGKDTAKLLSEGYIDSTGNLVAAHDAAHVQWGGSWRMPTKDELTALSKNCDWMLTTTNGVKGWVVHGRGNYSSASIFFPCAGDGDGTSLRNAGSRGLYWSSVPSSGSDRNAWRLDFGSSDRNMHNGNRSYGLSVRPVQGAVEKKATPSGGVQLWKNGPYWAECNVGATKPEEYGYYFWWGDTVGYKRENDAWVAAGGLTSYFSFSDGNTPTYGKDNSALLSAGYIDSTGNLVAAHDAATAHLGSPWRMPTVAESSALINNCTTTWITTNGVFGRLVTGKGGYADRSIFLPAAGRGNDSGLSGPSSNGYYWSSAPNSGNPRGAWYLGFGSSSFNQGDCASRNNGRSVRPVRGSAAPADSGKHSNALYCVIDLSAGPNADKYPVSYLNAEPKGGWTDEYKTTKLVLRRIEPGKFKMGGKYDVTLTKSFYIGVFEVTQRQYELVTGENPSEFKGDMRPVEKVSYDMVRGKGEGAKWPASSAVDSTSFMGKLRVRTRIDGFDLPTAAQWEYACRAGTTSAYNNGGDSEKDLKKLGRFSLNQKRRGFNESNADVAQHEPDGKGGYSENHTAVGSYLPNTWGLYDMHGNVKEWCLDWRGHLSSGATNPVGSSSGSCRVGRGGGWSRDALHCTSSSNDDISPSAAFNSLGFRLARTLSN